MNTEKLPGHLSELLYKDMLALLGEKEKQELCRLCRQYRIKRDDAEIINCLEDIEHFPYQDAYQQFIVQSRKKYRILSFAWKIAVVLVVLLGSSWWYYYRFHLDTDSVTMVAEKSIKPGNSKAIVTLANGERIVLENTPRQIEEADGTHIRTTGRELVYDSSTGKEDKLLYNTIDIPRGGEYCLVLSDGTKVWLNAESCLRYPIGFQGNKREVFLEGEAYFEVNREINKPFIVSTLKGNIQVLGTSFNVRAYRDEDKVSTVLESGKIKYISGQNTEVELLPGYMVEDRDGIHLITSKVNTRFYTGWKDGKYIFDDVSLEDIMMTLERWYDVNVFFANEHLKNLHFTGDLERYKNFNTILDFMETGGNVRFVVKGNTIIVEEK